MMSEAKTQYLNLENDDVKLPNSALDKNIVIAFNYDIKHTTGHYVYKALQKYANLTLIKPSEISEATTKNADLLLVVDDGSHNILSKIKIKKAIWIIDTHVTFAKDFLLLTDYDYIFCAHSCCMPKLGALGFKNIFWLPLGCDYEMHFAKQENKLYDVGFVGNLASKEREAILNKIKMAYPSSFIGNAPPEQMGQIYAASKVCFNKSIRHDVNMRFFECLCAGSPLLTDYIEDFEFLKLSQYITTYGKDEEIIGKINEIMDNQEKIKLAVEAQKIVLAKHTYERRILSLLSICFTNESLAHNFSFIMRMVAGSRILRKFLLRQYPNLLIEFNLDKDMAKIRLEKIIAKKTNKMKKLFSK